MLVSWMRGMQRCACGRKDSYGDSFIERRCKVCPKNLLGKEKSLYMSGESVNLVKKVLNWHLFMFIPPWWHDRNHFHQFRLKDRWGNLSVSLKILRSSQNDLVCFPDYLTILSFVELVPNLNFPVTWKDVIPAGVLNVTYKCQRWLPVPQTKIPSTAIVWCSLVAAKVEPQISTRLDTTRSVLTSRVMCVQILTQKNREARKFMETKQKKKCLQTHLKAKCENTMPSITFNI